MITLLQSLKGFSARFSSAIISTSMAAALLCAASPGWSVVPEQAEEQATEPQRSPTGTPLRPGEGEDIVAPEPSSQIIVMFQPGTFDDAIMNLPGIKNIQPAFPQLLNPGMSTAAQARNFQERMEGLRNRFAKEGRGIKQEPFPNLTDAYVLEFDSAGQQDLSQIAREIASDPRVRYATVANNNFRLFWTPNDPYFHSSNSWGQGYDDLWALKPNKLNMEAAWDLTLGQGQIVAVVDSGLDYNHPDIAANVVPGWNFVNNNDNPMDGHGHGTHVSGTIAAVSDNNLGIVGVAPEVGLMPVKSFNDRGEATDVWLANGIVYAAVNGASVINNSWGCNDACTSMPLLEDAVRAAHALGAVVVFAAGNTYWHDAARISPQNMTDPKPVVVAATNELDLPGRFTSGGSVIDVSAPGGAVYSVRVVPENILSLARGDGYARLFGTSMAAPHVAGIAALIRALHPEFTNDQVRQALRMSADSIAGYDWLTGMGRVNAASALAIDTLPALEASIASPAARGTFFTTEQELTVTGTATGADFSYYQLSYRNAEDPDFPWTPLGDPVTETVENGVLGIWPVADLPVAAYLLRLEVFSGGAQTPVRTLVDLAKELPSGRVTNTNTWLHARPDVDGDRIVYMDARRIYSHDAEDVYLTDLSTGEEHLVAQAPPGVWYQHTRIDGNYVVWTGITDDPQYQGIYVKDLTTGVIERIAGAAGVAYDPSISGNYVVWLDFRDGPGQIYVYDLTTRTERALGRSVSWPSISGQRVVWARFDDIYVYDLASDTLRLLPTAPGIHHFPEIHGDRVIYPLSYDFTKPELYIGVFDLSTDTETRILISSNAMLVEGTYHVSDELLVWTSINHANGVLGQRLRNGNWDIYAYDLKSGETKRLTTHLTRQDQPRVEGRRVVWMDSRHGRQEIYVQDVE